MASAAPSSSWIAASRASKHPPRAQVANRSWRVDFAAPKAPRAHRPRRNRSCPCRRPRPGSPGQDAPVASRRPAQGEVRRAGAVRPVSTADPGSRTRSHRSPRSPHRSRSLRRFEASPDRATPKGHNPFISHAAPASLNCKADLLRSWRMFLINIGSVRTSVPSSSQACPRRSDQRP